MTEVPESREVYEHGDREFDWLDEEYSRWEIFLAGMLAGVTLMFLLEVLS